MGYHDWNSVDYTAKTNDKVLRGVSSMSYTDDVISKTPMGMRKVHDRLNPKGVNRESRDSEKHPESNPIAVLFDVTGSMGQVPRILQEKLPKLMDMLVRRDLVKDPQVLFGCIGDATCDRAPLQVGQFESDITMDADLENIWIESGGGGQNTESYELGMHFMTEHTSCDSFEKRGKRGYLFIIADEKYYPNLNVRQVDEIIGGSLEVSLPIEEVVSRLLEKWDTYILMPEGKGAYINDKSIKPAWQEFFGQSVIEFNPEHISEIIAGIIGVAEGHDVTTIHEAMDAVGSSNAKASVSKSLSTVSSGSLVTGTLPAGKRGTLVQS